MKTLAELCVCTLGICLLGTAACRSPKWQSPDDIAAMQAERRAKVAKTVGMKQSEAELKLARDAWAFGDRHASLVALEGILEREPGHVEALLLKAEIHLAKDELIDADRSIAIALSHDPGSSTARRLSEIARTKQLAARPPEVQRPSMPVEAAPMPAGAVAQAGYCPTDAGTATVDDGGTAVAAAAQMYLASLSTPSTNAPAPAGSSPAADGAATSPLAETPIAEAATPSPAGAMAAAVEPPAGVEPEAGAPGFSEAADPIGDPALAVESPPSSATPATPPASQLPSHLAQSGPVGELPGVLRPEEATVYERADVPAGSAEVSDQSGSGDAPSGTGQFESALAASDSMAALAAVEKELTNNPNDPQIPISAAVAALEANQPETAASIARLGIAFHPSCAGLHRTLGAALYRTGNFASSQVALQQALSLDNTAALSYFLLGCVSEKLGDTEAAQAHFAHATQLDPSLADGK